MLQIYFGKKVLITLKEHAHFNLKLLLHVYVHLLSVKKRVYVSSCLYLCYVHAE